MRKNPGAGFETRLNAIFDLAKRWQRAIKLHAGFWGPGGTCFAQNFETLARQFRAKRCERCFRQGFVKPSLNAEFRPGKAGAKRAQGAQEGFVS